VRDISADILVGSLEGKRLLGRHSVDGRILLKWVLKKGCGLNSFGAG
jgi:hypothetical protein